MNRALILFLLFVIVLSNSLSALKYYGAEYRTKEEFTYGRFEASIKAAQRDGMLASFFTYHTGTSTSTWNEIDIEILGRYPNSVQFNTITPHQTNHVRSQPVNFNPSLDFHTYAFEWTPDYVAWFIDGEEVYRQTGEHIQTLTRPQKLMMNIWNPIYKNWVGIWNENSIPAFASYDFVSYYSYTPDSGSYGTENNFTHQWTDNLDSWDQTRWDKATHTWTGNGCTFIHDNAVFNDGKLILCLTDTEIGYTDKIAPYLLWARASSGKVTAAFSEELDKTSAENKSKFIISDVTVDSVRLLENRKHVEIYTTNLDLNKSYNLITLAGIKDCFDPANSSVSRAVQINMPKSLSFPIKINVGGEATSDYLADQEFNETTDYGYCEGSDSEVPANTIIEGTDEDTIYHSERYGLTAYKVRVPNGLYNVKLMMAENYFSTVNSRVFDIYTEQDLAIDNLDIFKLAGKNTSYDLIIKNVQVKDEILDIYFAAEIDNSLLNGIIVEQVTTGGIDESNAMPGNFQLLQNYPNPFNPSTVIKYSIPEPENVRLNVYDFLGQQVASLINKEQTVGNYEVNFNASMLSSGVYFYKLEAGNYIEIKKMILLR